MGCTSVYLPDAPIALLRPLVAAAAANVAASRSLRSARTRAKDSHP